MAKAGQFLISKLMPVRPEWNRMGPALPCWFRMKLNRFDPTLVLQYIPAADRLPPQDRRYGLNPAVCPLGGWQICRRIKNGWLHKLAVFSLTDSEGNPCSPTAETIKILRLCRSLWRKKDFRRMELTLESSLEEIKRNKHRASKDRLREAMSRFCSLNFDRQFSNRVFMGDSWSKFCGNGIS